ncbi:MAG: hypothetical protein WC979_08660 [Candidatus Pacearchaeota archaeon]|jgi:aspartyl/asparaginyl-tRNA synthetase
MKPLLTISLMTSIIGILILLILSNSLEPKKISIKDISTKDLNQRIETYGTITFIKTYSEFQTIKIKQDNYSITILINQKTNLVKNQTIEVTGKITEYKSSLEIQADKIKIKK